MMSREIHPSVRKIFCEEKKLNRKLKKKLPGKTICRNLLLYTNFLLQREFNIVKISFDTPEYSYVFNTT